MDARRKPSFEFEQYHSGIVAGIDEAGCGPWAGPVVAGACIFLDKNQQVSLLNLINDSKSLSKKKREMVFQQLIELPSHHFCYGVGLASVEEIDKMNIGQATRLAMQRAVASLPILPTIALVDGIRKPTLSQQVATIVKGDQQSYSIAAASIIAKVTRDRLMDQLHLEFPQYGWRKNAGYGTAQHQAALQQFGITPHHRRSFAPIAALVDCSSLSNSA